MSEQQDSNLARRVEKLEVAISELQEAVRELGDARDRPARQAGEPETDARPTAAHGLAGVLNPEPAHLHPPPPPPTSQPVVVRVPHVDFAMVRSSEWWLNKIGIGLLLLGLGFL